MLPVSWLAFETVDVAWPRPRPTPLHAREDQVWSTPPVVHRFAARPTDGR